jgi:hypothetical protein
MKEDHPTRRSEVVGYVLLEQCEVLLVVPTTTPPLSPGEDPAAAAGTMSPPPPPAWQDVDLRRRGCGGDASFRADDGIDDCGAGGRDLVLALAQPRPHPRDGEGDRDAPPWFGRTHTTYHGRGQSRSTVFF